MQQAEMRALNTKVIEEFRANEGAVGGQFEGIPLLLLTTTGARSGQPRISPLVYLADGDRLVVFAANGGSDSTPGWYHNLAADPAAEVEVEVGTDRCAAAWHVAEGAERERLWAAQVAHSPYLADFQTATERQIPVVVLRRV
ncbi:nitroreductase family deazaflavin-dependent oxidoreductase [Streptomyces sp. NPDC005355]|uniref:nitroreductase family deazaflavin-dependent oxidoreductase n=1 Tax=Streptomyces sp. NPDC005355 TaxID=3157038 RepID=UPI0033AEA2FD